MLTLLIPQVISGTSATPVLFEPDSEINEIDLQLRIWHDDKDDVTRFIYSPSGNATFLTDNEIQTLTVTLKSQVYDDNGVTKARFAIIGHTTKKKKLIDSVEHRPRGGNFSVTTPSHKFPVTGNIDAVKYKLKLKKHLDDTYINIIVQDMKDGSIIDCDPQAENGTKT